MSLRMEPVSAGWSARSAPIGSEPDLDAAYRAHFPGLVKLARLLGDAGEAEDLAQSAFIKLARTGGLRDPGATGAFLRQCVINQSRSNYRRRLRLASLLPRLAQDQVCTSPEDAQRLVIRQLLRRLPTRQREAVVLRYYADLSVAEAATVMGVSEGSVKAFTHRGIEKLSAWLAEEARA